MLQPWNAVRHVTNLVPDPRSGTLKPPSSCSLISPYYTFMLRMYKYSLTVLMPGRFGSVDSLLQRCYPASWAPVSLFYTYTFCCSNHAHPCSP